MNVVVFSLLLFLTGCSSSEQNNDDRAFSTSMWNPLNYHWSAILPWHWFSSSLTLNEQGLNGLNGQTVLSEKRLKQTLGSEYKLRSGMRLVNRDIIKFWQGMEHQQVAFEFIGNTTLERIEITTTAVKGPRAVQIGSAFSDTYQKAFPHCTSRSMEGDVRCSAPNSKHIFYYYTGKSNIPAGLLPPDAQLAKWKLSKMVWQP